MELEAHLWIFFRTMSENAKSSVFLGNSTFGGIYLGHRGYFWTKFVDFWSILIISAVSRRYPLLPKDCSPPRASKVIRNPFKWLRECFWTLSSHWVRYPYVALRCNHVARSYLLLLIRITIFRFGSQIGTCFWAIKKKHC